MKPVTIIGGGLAGLSLGIALRSREVPVRLIEAGTYPRHRVCGEFICGVRETTLETLGIADALADSRRHMSTAWFDQDGQQTYAGTLPRSAYGISRYQLDRRLAGRFEALGGTLETGRTWTGDFSRAGVVQAAGRPSHRSPWLGLKLHARGLTTRADLEIHLGRDAYMGISPVEGDRVNVCGLFLKRMRLRGRREQLLLNYLEAAGLGPLAKRLREAALDPDSLSGVSHICFHRTWRTADRLRIGDSYTVIPPFTGNGMSMAFESAEAALAPLLTWARNEADWPATLQAANQALDWRFRTRLATARTLHPLIYRRWGQAALQSLGRHALLPFRPLFQLTH
ncbi:MAG: NAD(P)/FAD-dependent oxidoreductase [Opitutales bacterium]